MGKSVHLFWIQFCGGRVRGKRMAPVQHKSALTFLLSSFFPAQLRDCISRVTAALPWRRTRSRANGWHRRVESHCWLQLEQRSLEGSSPTCRLSQPSLGKGKKWVHQGEPQEWPWAESTSYREKGCISQGSLFPRNRTNKIIRYIYVYTHICIYYCYVNICNI